MILDDSKSRQEGPYGLRLFAHYRSGKRSDWFKKYQAAATTPDPFQLVISDWNMPEMTGLEFLKAVRALPQGGNVPFVLLTAESDKSQVVEAIQARVSAYMTKPFATPVLGDKLKAVYAAMTKKAA